MAPTKKNTTTPAAVRLTHAGQALSSSGHDLPVLPDSENECEQKDQSGRQQDDLGVDSECAGHRLVWGK
jgi:hypothetical protein